MEDLGVHVTPVSSCFNKHDLAIGGSKAIVQEALGPSCAKRPFSSHLICGPRVEAGGLEPPQGASGKTGPLRGL